MSRHAATRRCNTLGNEEDWEYFVMRTKCACARVPRRDLLGNACNEGQSNAPYPMRTQDGQRRRLHQIHKPALHIVIGHQRLSEEDGSAPFQTSCRAQPFCFCSLVPCLGGSERGQRQWEGDVLADKVRKVPATCSGYTGPDNFAGLVVFASLILCCT